MTPAGCVEFGGQPIHPGERRDIELIVSHSYSGWPVVVPMTVWRAPAAGPTVFVTAAVHGDELNGTGVVRELILDPPFRLATGSLVLVPVVNMLGFDRHVRYLPDRRDLNRSFPGSEDGSLAARFAHMLFHQIVLKCDYGIDLHTAAVRRTNFPNVRADLANEAAARVARAFGCELVVDGTGPQGCLRRAACAAGVPTIILEAGEVWKIEPTVVEYGVRGIRNILIDLGMVRGKRAQAPYQTLVHKTKWVRAEEGGILQFHVAPGDIVSAEQPLATCTNLLGRDESVIASPTDGVVLGMTTLPAVSPGDPVCHIAIPDDDVDALRQAQERASERSLHERLRDDLAASISVCDPGENGD